MTLYPPPWFHVPRRDHRPGSGRALPGVLKPARIPFLTATLFSDAAVETSDLVSVIKGPAPSPIGTLVCFSGVGAVYNDAHGECPLTAAEV